MPRIPAPRKLRKLIAEREKSRGLLIAFEGPDGSGKTTQRKLLKRWLESQDHRVVSTRWASSALVKPMLKTRKKIRALSVEEYSLLHAVDFRAPSSQIYVNVEAAGGLPPPCRIGAGATLLRGRPGRYRS